MIFWRRKKSLPTNRESLPARVRNYVELFSTRRTRNDIYVVFDLETTGLNPSEDRILSFAFLRMTSEEVKLNERFEGFINLDDQAPIKASDIHQITRGDTSVGFSENEFIQEVLAFIGTSTLVGHHVSFDVDCLNQVLVKFYDFRLQNRTLDTAQIGARLDRAEPSAYTGTRTIKNLDSLCRDHGITPEARHSASGDAYTTALLFLKLLHKARKRGIRI